jgi:hypothetical protein
LAAQLLTCSRDLPTSVTIPLACSSPPWARFWSYSSAISCISGFRAYRRRFARRLAEGGTPITVQNRYNLNDSDSQKRARLLREFAAVFQSPEFGLAFQVALPAWRLGTRTKTTKQIGTNADLEGLSSDSAAPPISSWQRAHCTSLLEVSWNQFSF